MTTSEFVITDQSEEILATYNLCVVGPSLYRLIREVPLEHFEGLLREAEENITDLLPAGFRVVIREWNDEEETP